MKKGPATQLHGNQDVCGSVLKIRENFTTGGGNLRRKFPKICQNVQLVTHKQNQTRVTRSPPAFSAETDFTSKCNLPLAPSPQNSTRRILDNLLAVKQVLESPAHSAVCSPVADDHLSLKDLNGIFTSTKSSPAGTTNLSLKHPRLKGKLPPAAQAKFGLRAVATVTLYPAYSGVVVLTVRTRLPSAKAEMSGKFPSAAALINPGAESDGTSTTSPSKMPNPSPNAHDPVDCPPITGSFRILKVKDVASAPSNVTNAPGVEASSAVDVALM